MPDKETNKTAATAGYGRRRERKDRYFQLRLSDSELSKLNELSYINDETMSQVIRNAIKLYAKTLMQKGDE